MFVHCLCFYHGRHISQQKGTLCSTMKIFLCRYYTFAIFHLKKCCLINHHHAPFTYRRIGCCALTSQSSCFLAHILVSAASQPLNLNSPCLPGSKVALLSGFHLIKSGSQIHSQGNVYAHARSCKLYKSRRK